MQQSQQTKNKKQRFLEISLKGFTLSNRGQSNRRRHRPLLHLCPSHLVLLLSHGYNVIVGSSEEATASQALHPYQGGRQLPDEVQELCPSMPHAAPTLREQRK